MKILNNLLGWFSSSRLRMSISHCLEALIILLPVGFALNFWIGTLCVFMWYWSREKTQYEQKVKTPGQSNTTVWNKGWFPWEWDKDSINDLVFPVVSSSLIALLVTILGNYLP